MTFGESCGMESDLSRYAGSRIFHADRIVVRITRSPIKIRTGLGSRSDKKFAKHCPGISLEDSRPRVVA
jgi:hypothetical protein